MVFNHSERIIFAWAYSFEKKGDGLLLFIKAFSWDTDLWVMLGDFKGEKSKLGKRNVFNLNQTWCAADYHNYMCHINAQKDL